MHLNQVLHRALEETELHEVVRKGSSENLLERPSSIICLTQDHRDIRKEVGSIMYVCVGLECQWESNEVTYFFYLACVVVFGLCERRGDDFSGLMVMLGYTHS